jgi:hypothetical protein
MPAWLLLSLLHSAQAGRDLPTSAAGPVGSRAQVLVLGTLHLSALPDELDARTLDFLLDRLAVYKPDLITTEALSCAECETAWRYGAAYAETFRPGTAIAKAAPALGW